MGQKKTHQTISKNGRCGTRSEWCWGEPVECFIFSPPLKRPEANMIKWEV